MLFYHYQKLPIIVFPPLTISPSSTAKLKPIGTIIALDNNEIDSKIVSVAVNNLQISRLNSIDDLEKNYIGLFEIIKIWIENYKGEAIEIKNILGKNPTKKYIDQYHQKFLLNKNN